MFLPYIDMNQPPSWNSIPLPSPYHPSGVSQHTSFECPVSWIDVQFSGHDSLIRPRDQTCVSQVSCVGGGFFTTAPPGMHPLIPLLDSYARQRKTYLHTKTCMKSQSSIIHTTDNVEDTQVSTNRSMEWSLHLLLLLFSQAVVSDSLRPFGL